MSVPFSQTSRALALDSPRITHVALAGAVAVLLAWSAWFVFGRVTVYEVSRHARLESAAAPRDITAGQAGRLAGAQLAIGRVVRAGDVLVELDAADDALQAAEEQARLTAYPTKTEALRRQIAALRAAAGDDARATQAAVAAAAAHLTEASAAADFALDNARRMKAQAAVGGVADVEALRADAEARKAVSAREAAAADMRRLALDARTRAAQGEAQIQELERTLAATLADAAASQASASRLQLQVQRKTIRAPVDGVIAEALPLKPGAYVAEGQKVATIVPRGGLTVIAEFDPTTALGRLNAGQGARLRLDGFPWAQYGAVRARVSHVAGDVRDGGLRVELAPDVAAARPGLLRHGLTGVVEVSVERVSPAVLLLRAAGRAAGLSPAAPAAGARP